MGIRLDGGTAYSGGVITRYYDSLLVKVTAKAQTPEQAIARMDRALREFRIRGVSDQYRLCGKSAQAPDLSVERILQPSSSTRRRNSSPFKSAATAATKVLTYIGDITVNGHPETKAERRCRPCVPHAPVAKTEPTMGTRNLLEQRPAALSPTGWQAASNC